MSGSKTIYVGIAQKKAEREELLKQQFSEKPGEDYPKVGGSGKLHFRYV